MWSKVKSKLANYQSLARLYKAYRRSRVKRRSRYTNIYYCCTQKTASQWFKAVFSDPAVYSYTGLEVYPFTQLVSLDKVVFDAPLPRHSICTNLYLGYPNYSAIQKPKDYKSFFVLRDPRDIVVSSYFSLRHSHVPIGRVPSVRRKLEQLSLTDGLKYVIDVQEEEALFWAQKTWVKAAAESGDIKVFRYEDLSNDTLPFLEVLFYYLNIEMPKKEFVAMYNRHKFEKYSGGRKRGKENHKSHYRKGVSGDWQNYFDRSTMAYFGKVTGDLLEVLGYAEQKR